MKKSFLLLFLSCLSLVAQHATVETGNLNARGYKAGFRAFNASYDIIPSTRRFNMTNVVGIYGGIPNPSTYITLGSTVTVAQLNAHIVACPSNQQIALLDGTYNLTSGNLTYKSGVSFNGQSSNTIIQIANNTKIGPAFSISSVAAIGTNLLTSGYALGSTNLVTATTTFLDRITNGATVYVSELNDDALVHPWGYEIPGDARTPITDADAPFSNGLTTGIRNRAQGFTVTGINGNNIGIWPPISGRGYSSSLSPMVHYPMTNAAPGNVNHVSYVGFRNLSITNSAGNMFQLDNCQNIWFSNVTFHVSTADTPALMGNYSHRISIQGCNFYGYGTSPACILCWYYHNGWLIENNFFNNVNQAVYFKGAGGFSAILYNFSRTTNVTTALIAEVGGHGATPQFVYFEGNDFRKFQGDNAHGNMIETILFRNRFRGQESFSTFGYGCVAIDNFNYFFSVVGNELGTFSVTSGYGEEVICPATAYGSLGFNWRIGYSGYNPTNISNPMLSLVREGNVDYTGGTTNIRWYNPIFSRSLTNSYYYASKPSFFGATQPWPLFGPDTTLNNYTPAEYRLTNGFATPP